jgi:hypothetical protein
MNEELFSANMKSNKPPSGGPIHLRSFSLDTETVFIDDVIKTVSPSV